MTNDLHKNWYLRYGLAVLAAFAGLWLRLVITHWVGPELPTYITFYPLVMMVALLGGIGPGIVTTILVALLVDCLLLAPAGSFKIDQLHDIVGSVFFTAMGVMMSVVAGLYRNTRGNLESLVGVRTRELAEVNTALQQQVALIDPARAKAIVQEMQRIVRERDMRAPPAPVIHGPRHIPRIAGALAAGAGLLVLAGWLFGIEMLKCVGPGLATMKANTAICFILTGAALLLHDRKVWRSVLAAIVCVVGSLTLMEHFLGINAGLDQLLFRDLGSPETAHAGRMAPLAAVSFILISAALLLQRTSRNVRIIGQTLALITGLIGIIALIGYLYGDQEFYRFGGTTNMAIHTALLFVVLAIGFLFVRTDGLIGMLLGPNPGAQLARRLLPTILLVPPVLGRLCDYGVQHGFYADPSGTALFALAMMISLAALTFWTAGVLTRADCARRDTEARLRNQAELMDQATDALIVRDTGGIIRFWNRGAERLYGWPAGEVVGQRLHTLLRTEGVPPELETLLQQYGRWEGELQQTTQSGNRILVESRKTAIRAADGRLLVLESTRDITGRREAKKEAARLHDELKRYAAEVSENNAALILSRRAAFNLMEDAIAAREQAEQLNRKMLVLQEKEKADAIRIARAQSAATTLRAMQEGVALLELDGTIVFANPAAENLTGILGGQLVGKNISTLLPMFLADLDLEIAQQGLELLRGGKTPELLPLQFRNGDGHVRQILPSLAMMGALEAGDRQMAVLTLKDVTELHEAVYLREEGERKYRELVENANSIIMRITPDHNILFFNEYAQAFFGYAAAEVLGRNVVGTIVPPVDSEGRDLQQMMQEIAAQPELCAQNENENRCKDGRRVWVHWSNRAVRDAQGHVVEILCVGTDITERREMEAEAQRYQERLRELAERLAVAEEEDRWRISRYIHDTVIQNLSLSNIRMGSMLRPLREADLSAEADKLEQIRGLLSQAIDECRMVMSDLTPALLYELGMIPALQDLARQLTAKHGARIVVEPEGREATVSNVLRGVLFESVRELIVNALKHAGPCEIRVGIRADAHELILCVADNGKGFATPAAAKPASKQGGFGLLNIRQRVEGLGGRLEIVSVPGQGTTATIRMPMADDGE